MGFGLNVGQQNPYYVKGRQAGKCKKRAAGGCAAVTMESAVAHISLPEHRWRWTGREAARKRRRAPTMKTVLSLHRKWAHAVKTIRILQGLVSVILLQIWSALWPGQVARSGWFCNGSGCLFLNGKCFCSGLSWVQSSFVLKWGIQNCRNCRQLF